MHVVRTVTRHNGHRGGGVGNPTGKGMREIMYFGRGGAAGAHDTKSNIERSEKNLRIPAFFDAKIRGF